jgi:hypothetical protein
MKQREQLSVQPSQTGGAVSIPRIQELVKAGPEEMHRNGTSVSRANSESPELLRAFLGREIVRLSQAVKVNNTFSSEEDVLTAVEDIIDEFRTLKIEEVVHVFTQIRRGKIDLYGRLDTPTLCAALREYDVNTACEFREKHYKEALQTEPLSPLFGEILKSLPEVTPTFAEIMQRRPKLTPEQRAEIHARDKARNGYNTGTTGGDA